MRFASGSRAGGAEVLSVPVYSYLKDFGKCRARQKERENGIYCVLVLG